jgi:glycosyltransferase involved in cell wall biosynthesis
MDSSLPEQLLGKYRALHAVDGLLNRIERFAIARSDLVMAVCEDLASRARAYATATPVNVVEDVSLLGTPGASGGVEDLRRDLPPGGALLLYVGNLEHYQGVELLLDGLAALDTRTPFRFVAIGGTTDAVATLRERAAQLGLADRVVFAGARPVQALGAYLEQADVLVSPRLKGHNTPMKLYSYLAAGKAVLATRIRSHTQVLTPECALLVEPTPADVAAGLSALLESPALRTQLGEAAYRLATTRYSLPQFRESVARAYRQLAPAAGAA